jgi:hypothetical protein
MLIEATHTLQNYLAQFDAGLGIDQVNSGRRPFIFVGDDQQLEIEFRGLPTDAEALFFIALSMATSGKACRKSAEKKFVNGVVQYLH